MAVKKRNLAMVKLLVKYHADPNVPDKTGSYVVHALMKDEFLPVMEEYLTALSSVKINLNLVDPLVSPSLLFPCFPSSFPFICDCCSVCSRICVLLRGCLRR